MAWQLTLLIMILVVRGLIAGVTGLGDLVSWLATQSALPPLFPAPGDSVVRYALAILTLLILIPGPVYWLAALVR